MTPAPKICKDANPISVIHGSEPRTGPIMKTTPAIKTLVKEIGRRAFAQPIAVRWASTEIMPGVGERKSPHRGAGDDFDGFDEYLPGDDPRDIDWNATALTGGQQVIVSKYREPRELKAYVVA